MKTNLTSSRYKPNFESIKKTTIDRDGKEVEFWSARELSPLLGYSEWRNFERIVEKAMEACSNSNLAVEYHFVNVNKMILIGSGTAKEALRKISDYQLTRYACYLIAQNGDPRKEEIAFAQSYFAIQTRKQELMQQRQLEDKRLQERDKLKDVKKKIKGTVYERGISKPLQFATFENTHIAALYGGFTIRKLKEARNIPRGRALEDFDSTVELTAKAFSLAIADRNIKDNDITGEPRLNLEVEKSAQATREALIKRGITPETLPAEEDLRSIERRRKKDLKQGQEQQLRQVPSPLDRIILHWPSVIEEAKKASLTVGALLTSCEPLDVTNDALKIFAKYSFHRDQLSKKDNTKIVEDAIEKTTGEILSCIVVS